MGHPLYRLSGPTAWAQPPATWSFSSLAAVERCPRQWQLAHSRYGDLTRFPARPNPAAVEGDIVHACLDGLFKALALRGMPALGTPAFREGLAEVDLHGQVRRLIAEHESELAEHPRATSFRLRVSPQQLVNQVIRLFRGLYKKATSVQRRQGPPSAAVKATGTIPGGPALVALLEGRNALSDLRLVHPGLPFTGVLDLIWMDEGGSVLTDFKTGGEKPEHLQQVACYCVLWWRSSGVVPARAEVRYPDRCVSVATNEDFLEEVEAGLRRRLDVVSTLLASTPARANRGNHCRHCDVRQFCDTYWSDLHPVGSLPGQDALDVEVIVVSDPSRSGFEARTGAGKVISVVFSEDVARIHGPFTKGERLRILGGKGAEGEVVELKSWTEVFRERSMLEARPCDPIVAGPSS